MATAPTTWNTAVTRVAPNSLLISGYPLEELIEHCDLAEIAHLLVAGELPSAEALAADRALMISAARLPAPPMPVFEGEDISQALAKCMLLDKPLHDINAKAEGGRVHKTMFALGRMARYLALLLGHEAALDAAGEDEPFALLLSRVVTGKSVADPARARMLEAMVVASVDHGVTPPSAQATILASSVRGTFEMCVANGIGAITDVHGGAGQMAADFFLTCATKAQAEHLEVAEATRLRVAEATAAGYKIKGLGHRVHSEDPRRTVLWNLVESLELAGPCVGVSRVVGDIFAAIKGRKLPINVDGVIGAIVADLGVPTSLAKALFVYGRVAGLAAHHFEEISTQSEMRRINFSDAAYSGPELRHYPTGH